MMNTMSNDVLVKTNGLTKLYTMGETTVTALDGVSLNIKRGSFTVVMGPSGSGKSAALPAWRVGLADLWRDHGGQR